MENYLFEKHIRLFGIRRSGNSGILSFIKNHFEDGVIVYTHNTDLTLLPKVSFSRYGEKKTFQRVVEYIDALKERFVLLESIESMFPMIVRNTLNCGFSYSNKMINRLLLHYDKDKLANETYNLILLRSSHNNLASLIKRKARAEKSNFEFEVMLFPCLWTAYACEYLNETNYLSERKLGIEFDLWFESEKYRRKLSSFLGLEYEEKGIHFFARHVGSSFDRHKYNGQAQKMKVLDRWKYYKGDKFYSDLLSDKNLIHYTERIFRIDLRKLL